MVVQIGHGGEHCADQVCSVRLIVAAFATDAVKKFPAQREIGDKIYYTASFVSGVALVAIMEEGNTQLFIVSK